MNKLIDQQTKYLYKPSDLDLHQCFREYVEMGWVVYQIVPFKSDCYFLILHKYEDHEI